jgi:hypothetical protein
MAVCAFSLWRVIWLTRNWQSICRTRQILPLLHIYQIRQGTRLHSRPAPKISYRDSLTFTSLTVHTHTLSLTCTVFNNINCWSLTVGCLISNWQQRQKATAATQTADGGNRQYHQQATTIALGGGYWQRFVRHYKFFKFWTFVYIHNIFTLANVAHTLTV